jgi:hypothetical protein
LRNRRKLLIAMAVLVLVLASAGAGAAAFLDGGGAGEGAGGKEAAPVSESDHGSASESFSESEIETVTGEGHFSSPIPEGWVEQCEVDAETLETTKCVRTKVPKVPPREFRCVLLWNRDADNAEEVKGAIAPLAGATNVYASVTFAADYPDLCLVTFVAPANGSGMQFVESEVAGNHVYMPVAQNVDPGNLDPNVSNWNAEVDEYGQLDLKKYGSAQLGED